MTGKCAFQVKKLKEYIITHVPQGKIFPKVLINTPQAEGINYSLSQSSIFFKNLLPQAEREGEGHYYEGSYQP